MLLTAANTADDASAAALPVDTPVDTEASTIVSGDTGDASSSAESAETSAGTTEVVPADSPMMLVMLLRRTTRQRQNQPVTTRQMTAIKKPKTQVRTRILVSSAIFRLAA